MTDSAARPDADREQAWGAAIDPHIDSIGGLIRAMHALCRLDGFLDPASFPLLADRFNLSRAEVKTVASFYDDFPPTPPAPHELRICRAEACQAVGSRELVDTFIRLAPDSARLSERPVYCLGLCASGPAAVLDGQLHARVSPAQLEAWLGELDD